MKVSSHGEDILISSGILITSQLLLGLSLGNTTNRPRNVAMSFIISGIIVAALIA